MAKATNQVAVLVSGYRLIMLMMCLVTEKSMTAGQHSLASGWSGMLVLLSSGPTVFGKAISGPPRRTWLGRKMQQLIMRLRAGITR